MSQKEHAPRGHLQLMGLTLLLLAGCFIFHIKNASSGVPLYRDQHLGTAVQYYKTKIDLLKPVIIGFNATGTPTPQELPVWQALAGLAFKMLGPWYGWANLVSLLVFCTSLFPLFRLAKIFAGERAAWWTLVFFLSQPLIFMLAGEASTDGFSLVTAIWFLFFGVGLLQRGTLIWWIPTMLMGALAAVSKLPFFMTAGLTCFFVLVTRHRNSPRAWLLLASAGAVIVALFFWWTSYTNRCIAAAEFPFVDLRLSHSDSSLWYFGDLKYRLHPGNWLKGGWRVLNACFGSFAFVGVFLHALFFLRDSFLGKLLLLSAFITTLVFTHLVLHHVHYYLMFTPAFAVFCAVAASDLEKKLSPESLWLTNASLAIVAAVLGLSIVQGLIGIKIVLHFDPYPYEMAGEIQKYCSPTDKLLIEGGGWGGNELMLSDRKGMSIWNTKLLDQPENLKRLKELGYDKLVMISDSPLLVAVQQVNPGESKFHRQSYREFMTPLVNDWPTLRQTEDILIKEIP